MLVQMLDKLSELGMMTSEYVYILPVIDINLSEFYLTPWISVKGKPHLVNVKMVSF